MGSVKDLIRDDSLAGRLYVPPTATDFGIGAWRVSGRFSVGDLKHLIPDANIKDKAEALTMSTAAFFEWLAYSSWIRTCYEGVMDKNGKVTDTKTLLERGETSNIIVMRLAHVPETFCDGELKDYRTALQKRELRCGVADIESIFRHGFPLGSSTFEKIFDAVGMKARYETLATYDDTVQALDEIRRLVQQQGIGKFPELEKLLKKSGLKNIPNPGHVLSDIVYDTTTKFEAGGDRRIDKTEAQKLSGLSVKGYQEWAEKMFPALARAQIAFCGERGILNIDGKAECVAYYGMPVVTDFCCTVDENRLMIETEIDGVKWAIPSNKEIQRAVFRQAGVYAAISEAKEMAASDGDANKWRDYVPTALRNRRIDLRAVSEHSCELMGHAIGEVANRTLGKRVFDAKPLETWTREFLPYASKVEEEAA